MQRRTLLLAGALPAGPWWAAGPAASQSANPLSANPSSTNSPSTTSPLSPPAATRDEAEARFAQRLHDGGVAVLLRHAITDPGIGDPPGFEPGVCRSQRNLSAEGRAQARRIGARFAARRLVPAAVRSSEWCRCLDTGQLAFGRVAAWPALNSSFGDRALQIPQNLPLLRQALGHIGAGTFEVWVTHQSNITGWTSQAIGMGEGFAVARSGNDAADPTGPLRVAARLRLGA